MNTDPDAIVYDLSDPEQLAAFYRASDNMGDMEGAVQQAVDLTDLQQWLEYMGY